MVGAVSDPTMRNRHRKGRLWSLLFRHKAVLWVSVGHGVIFSDGSLAGSNRRSPGGENRFRGCQRGYSWRCFCEGGSHEVAKNKQKDETYCRWRT